MWVVVDRVELDGAVLRIWVLVSAQVKYGMVELSSPFDLLEPWGHVPLWAPLSPLELPHRDVGGNAPLWAEAWKVGEVQVVVVGRDGVGWLRVEMFWPVVGATLFVGPQYRYMGQLVPGVG